MNYLALQATYEQLELGIFKDNKCIDAVSHDKKMASTVIISALDQLCKKNMLNLRDFSFIAVNQGPAPFTSLRVVIATANGLSFATGLPLVGVDGLKTFMQEYHNPAWPSTVALLNAFNQDVYFAYEHKGTVSGYSYKNIEKLLEELKTMYQHDQQIRFIGNGATLYKKNIDDTFGAKTFFPEPFPAYPSLAAIAQTAYEQWLKTKKGASQLLPLYLKQLHYQQSITD
ncbi:MAG: tRNA (adenosine(37)-N6)-threonylcarbamoyltransferase complex dimerization subunit type 1 TsaB [Candidatus Babeliales bacterium]